MKRHKVPASTSGGQAVARGGWLAHCLASRKFASGSLAAEAHRCGADDLANLGVFMNEQLNRLLELQRSADGYTSADHDARAVAGFA